MIDAISVPPARSADRLRRPTVWLTFASQIGIIVDCLCDGFVDRIELTGELRDRHIGQGLLGGRGEATRAIG
jgi:hypothetical protein